MTVTFTSRDVRNHVLEGVRHLANGIVVFLKYCVFSCLAELLQPGISLGLRTSINIKNKIYRKFIRTRNQFLYLKVKLYGNKLNHLKTLNFRKYYKGYFRCNKSNIKTIWKGIKELVAFKPKAYTTPTKIVTSSTTVLTKASDIANAFNHYFVNVGKSLSQTIPKVDVSFSSFLFNP